MAGTTTKKKTSSKKTTTKKTASKSGSSASARQPMRLAMTVPITSLVMPPKKLVVRKDVGDIGELTKSIRTHGQEQSLLVRPRGTKFEVLCGQRRWAAMKQVKSIKSAHVIIARDLEDDTAALGAIMTENGEDVRTAPTPLEQAEAFNALYKQCGGDKDKGAINKVAKLCSTSAENVRRKLRFVSAPPSIKERLQDQSISSDAVIALQQIDDPKIARKVNAAITSGEVTTRKEIQELAKAEAKAAKADGKSTAKPKDKRKAAAPSVVWKGKKDMREALEGLLYEYAVATGEIEDDEIGAVDDEQAALLKTQIGVFAWIMGETDEITDKGRQFNSFIKAETKRVVAEYEYEEDEEDEEVADEQPESETAEDTGDADTDLPDSDESDESEDDDESYDDDELAEDESDEDDEDEDESDDEV
jgi:ParB family chromosome partitioning protein